MAIYKIGRAEGNHIVLGDKSVSRQHAELEELGAGRFRLKDLGSSSGTRMLSGADWIEVQEAEVRHDTKIRFGEYETTPMDLVRDQDKTVVQARPSPAVEAPKPAAPKPAPPTPPRPAAAKPAPPRPAAPRPAAPRPAAPRPAPRPAPAAGGGMDKKTLWFIVGGGGALLLLALIAVVVVLATGGEQRAADVREPPRTEGPRIEAPPAAPRREAPPPAQAGPQRFFQACRTTWGFSEAGCQCALRAVQPVLQEGDYDDAIAVLSLAYQNKTEDVQRRLAEVRDRKGADTFQRIVQAAQALARDCKDAR